MKVLHNCEQIEKRISERWNLAIKEKKPLGWFISGLQSQTTGK